MLNRLIHAFAAGLVPLLGLTAIASAQSSFMGPTYALILGHDGPEPAIWSIPLSSPSIPTKIFGPADGLTGVWGLTTGGGEIWWTHKETTGTNAGETMLSSWDGYTTGITSQIAIRHSVSNEPVEISGLAYYDGMLYGTGPDDGWTQFPEPPSYTTIYVSSSDGDDGDSGFTPETAKATITAGLAALDDESSDRLLLKRGDTWNERVWWNRTGDLNDLEHPMVIGSYGTAAARPKIVSTITGTDPDTIESGLLFGFGTGALGNVALTDLHLVCEDCDRANAAGITIYANWRHLLIENCKIEGYWQNVVISNYPETEDCAEIAIRRSVITDARTAYPGTHAVGLYAEGVEGLLVEECIFDENGYSDKYILGTAAGGDVDFIVLQGDTADEYARNMTVTITSGSNNLAVRKIANSYGTRGAAGDHAPSISTIRLSDNAHPGDDFYNGADIKVGSQTLQVSDYDGASRTASMNGNWTSLVAKSTSYEITGAMVPSLFVDSSYSSAITAGTTYTISGFYGNEKRHNTYLQSDMSGIVMRGNISSRSSANGLHVRPGGLLDANLCLNNPIGIFLGYDDIQGSGTTRNNAILGAQDIPGHNGPEPRSSGFYTEGLADLDIYGNLIAHQGGTASNVSAFHVGDRGPQFDVERVRLFQNRFFNWYNPTIASGTHITLDIDRKFDDTFFLYNHLQQPSAGITSRACIGIGLTWRMNLYGEISSQYTALTTWMGMSCVNESSSLAQTVTYSAPYRDIATYMGLSFGHSAGIDNFMDDARDQERGNWDEDITAAAVLGYVREGFDMPPLPARPRRVLYEIDPSTGVATEIESWDAFDFGGIEIDQTTGTMYGISTRDRATDSRSVLYELGVSGPVEKAVIAVPEMEGLALGTYEYTS